MIYTASNKSIWCSTADKSSYNQSESGILQYDTQLDKITTITEYPQDIILKAHVCCQYKNKIYLIDGIHGFIVEFDINEKVFTKKIDIPKVGGFPSVASIFDTIHIFNGRDNTNEYLIYDINTNCINAIELKKARPKLESVSAFVYNNYIIQLGGYCNIDYEKIDTVKITMDQLNTDNVNDAPEWITKSEWKLPKPLNRSGHILYKNYLIITGGVSNKHMFMDEIFVLDLTRDDGWIQLKHIKCPIKSTYITVLTDDNYLHLFSSINTWPGWKNSERVHYSMPISTLLGSKFISDNK